MKTIKYTNLLRDEKLAVFGEGPWLDEPDKVQWQNKKTGLPCLAIRHQGLGHWCGYVGVPEGHPAFGKRYDDVDVSVHGGLTFADSCREEGPQSEAICHIPEPGETDKVWWLGFDCSHAWDISPRHLKMFPEFHGESLDQTYRTLQYTQRQAASLAVQLRAMEGREQ